MSLQLFCGLSIQAMNMALVLNMLAWWAMWKQINIAAILLDNTMSHRHPTQCCGSFPEGDTAAPGECLTRLCLT